MIKVQVDAPFDSPVNRGVSILVQLRKAGVPAVGVLWPEGVQHGELSVACVDGKTTYTWTPDPLLED